MVNLLPCPFCGGTEVENDWDDYWSLMQCCATCGARGGVVEDNDPNCKTEVEKRAKAIELWNRRAVIDETEYWAGVIEQTVINGRAGFLEFARAYSKPGVTFTDEQNAAIKAAVARGDTAEAQRMILDVLNEAIGEDWLHGRGDAKPIGLLFGLPIVEVDMPDMGKIVIEEWPDWNEAHEYDTP